MQLGDGGDDFVGVIVGVPELKELGVGSKDLVGVDVYLPEQLGEG